MKSKSKNPSCKVCGKLFVVYFSWNGTDKPGQILLAHNEEDHKLCTRIIKVMDKSAYQETDTDIKVKRGLACYSTKSEKDLAMSS